VKRRRKERKRNGKEVPGSDESVGVQLWSSRYSILQRPGSTLFYILSQQRFVQVLVFSRSMTGLCKIFEFFFQGVRGMVCGYIIYKPLFKTLNRMFETR
jgi:hypothetical protein